MAFWSFYFLGKLFLYMRGVLRFDAALNILFFLFLVLRFPKRVADSKLLKAAKLLLSGVFAFLLLWHDSWLPPLIYVFHFIANDAPSLEYMIKFVVQALSSWNAAALLCLLVLCILLSKKITLTPITLILMLAVLPGNLMFAKADVGHYFDAFHKVESSKLVRFDLPAKAVDFDIVFLHV